MFTEFENQSYTPSDGTVVVSNNTDYSIDGSSKKLVWSDSSSATVTIGFDSVTLSDYEEISFFISQKQALSDGNIFSIEIDGNTFNFEKLENGWQHILIDCSSMGAETSIVITSLVEDLTLFVDYLGYRKADYNIDVDLTTALKNHISLSYGVSTTLSANASVGSSSISLTSKSYITDTSVLQLDDGAGTTEEVDLLSRNGDLKETLSNAFSSGDTVNVLCPVRTEGNDTQEADPICGIMVYNKSTDKEDVVIDMKGGSKLKKHLGILGVLIYIDCSSKKKLLQLAREFDFNYGERFEFLLDGELVDVYLESSQFIDESIGGNPRVAYFYEILPQPITDRINVAIDSLTVDLESIET